MFIHDPFDALVAGLGHEDEVVQADAARLLGELAQRRAVDPLAEYVTTCRYYSKTAGLDALGALGDPAALPALRQLMADPNVDDDWFWYCRRAVLACIAVALLRLGDDSGADYLEERAAKDDDVFFCWYGPAILRLPDEPEAAKRLKALITVEKLGGPGDRRTRNSDPAVVTMKAEALGLLGGDEACRLLRELMTFHSRYVRGRAAQSLLAAEASAEHVAAVEAVADGDETDFARIKASLALVEAGRPERGDFLIRAANSAEDPFDRATAVEALGLVGDAAGIGAVTAELDHDDPYVRQCALEALERLDVESAVTEAKGRREDENVRVRLQAAKVLAAEAGEGRS